MHAVLGLIIHHGLRPVHDAVGDFDITIGGQRMHVDGIRFGESHLALIGDPVRVLLDDFCALIRVGSMNHGAPGLRVDNISILECRFHVLGHFETSTEFSCLLPGLLHDLGHQLEFRWVSKDHIHAEPWHLQDKALGDRHWFLVRSRIGP